MATTGFVPRARPWDSLELLGPLARSDIFLSDRELRIHVELFDNDMVAEYDADVFARYLEARADQGLTLSPEFQAFVRGWRRDEWNHYVGYRRLYSLCYGEPEDALHARVIARTPDFGAISEFLGDEFTISMVLAYDEIVTAKSCAMDYEAFDAFGHPSFGRWIRRVGRDEGFHFWNIVRVLRRVHRHRLPEVPQVLDRLIAWDLAGHPYGGTFVLDHGDRFTAGDLDSCGRAIERLLTSGTPRAAAAPAAGTWTPPQPRNAV